MDTNSLTPVDTSPSTFECLVFKRWHSFLWLILLTFLVYGHTLLFDQYTYMDDYFIIVESHPIIGNLGHLRKVFVEDVFHQHQSGIFYRPILTLSLMLDAQLGGTDPFVYRFTNILLHGAVALLLLVTLRAFGMKPLSSLVASAFFVVHPAFAQAVVWIPGRNDSLLAIFLLAALVSVLRYQTSHRVKWFFLHLLFFALALFTKESAILFPGLVLLLLVWNSERPIPFLQYVLFVVGWLVIAVQWSILRQAATIQPIESYSYAISIIAKQSWAILAYLGTLIWPVNIFTVAVAQDLSLTAGIVATVLVGAMFTATPKHRRKLFVFGLFWFILFLLPTFYRHMIVKSPMRFFEHRLYVPALGLFFLAASLSLGEYLRRWQSAAGLFLIFVLLALAILTFRHSFSFADGMYFSEQSARTSPQSPFVHLEASMMRLPPELQRLVTFKKADTDPSVYYANLRRLLLDYERTSLERDHDLDYQLSVAALSFGMGRLKTAETHLLKAVSLSPNNTVAHYNFGVLYYNGHRERLAEERWRKTLELDPSFGDAHQNLSYLYYTWKRYSLALAHAERAEACGAKIPRELFRELRDFQQQYFSTREAEEKED